LGSTSAEGNIWPFRIWCAVCMESSGLVYPNSNDFSTIRNLYLKKTNSLPTACLIRTKLKSPMPPKNPQIDFFKRNMCSFQSGFNGKRPDCQGHLLQVPCFFFYHLP
jgi:hypothetical protein